MFQILQMPMISQKFYHVTILIICLLFVLQSFGQQKRTNWLQEKNQHTGRWRVGIGADVAEPTGFDIQFYRLSRICTRTFSIAKKISIGVWAGKEGVLLGTLIDRQNSVDWKSGGIRYGMDIKFYFPIALNPYIGVGIEGGKRNLAERNEFSTDVVARIGLEQKLAGIKISTSSAINITVFLDGKLNKSVNSDFMYAMPGFGVRLHWL